MRTKNNLRNLRKCFLRDRGMIYFLPIQKTGLIVSNSKWAKTRSGKEDNS
jgi:hypothetical protein